MLNLKIWSHRVFPFNGNATNKYIFWRMRVCYECAKFGPDRWMWWVQELPKFQNLVKFAVFRPAGTIICSDQVEHWRERAHTVGSLTPAHKIWRRSAEEVGTGSQIFKPWSNLQRSPWSLARNSMLQVYRRVPNFSPRSTKRVNMRIRQILERPQSRSTDHFSNTVAEGLRWVGMRLSAYFGKRLHGMLSWTHGVHV